ncbi:MAG: 2-dehydro-3-deoxygluconokinase [Rhodospirillaceae bacterium]|nr:2-dehydro-3-deoxygluconokinase [Rhodospirillaceae bacterium]
MIPKDIDIVCLGEAMIEFTRVRNSPNGPLFVQGLGGDTSNCAIAAARQGATAAYMTVLGDDKFGKMALCLWKLEGIIVSGVSLDPKSPTGIYFIEPLVQGREFTYYRKGSAASRMTSHNINPDVIERASFLHFSSISQAISKNASDACQQALKLAKKHNTQISYDINLRLNLWNIEMARDTVHKTAALVDILLPSLDESRILTGLESVEDIVEFYLQFKPSLLVLKCGSEGAIVAYNEQKEHIKAIEAKVLDTSGAGDTFDGAFLARLTSGDHPVEAARYAVVAAGLSVEGYGAVTPIPNKAEVLQKMKGD